MPKNLTSFSSLTWIKPIRFHRCFPLKIRVVAGLTLTVLSVASLAGARGLPIQNGIGNFGQINDGFYRGAQPDEVAIKSLKRLGVKTIVNLRMEGDTWKKEAQEAQANGITYVNVPLRGAGRPT